MISQTMQSLVEWHTKFDVPISKIPKPPNERRRKLRIKLIQEEFNELCEADKNLDCVEYADALADLIYVIYGAALEWGIPLDDVFNEVHRSNMSKVWPDGTVKYRVDGKVLKPPTYSKANIRDIINKAKNE